MHQRYCGREFIHKPNYIYPTHTKQRIVPKQRHNIAESKNGAQSRPVVMREPVILLCPSV